MIVRERVPLAPRCTLGVGGPARYLVEAGDEAAVLEALAWARHRRLPCRVLGGGSNLVVADGGVDGLVVAMRARGIAVREAAERVEVTAAAGEPWDDLVSDTVARGLAGLECLSGIPGLVGATPIQNVGAYGQEVAATVVSVRCADTVDGGVVTLEAADCGFAYRDSRFKREPGRFVVLAVTYRLRRGAPDPPRYAELAAHLERAGVGAPTPADVQAAVLAIRRAKSMVIEAGDPNRRSCGSFFLNPVVDAGLADAVARQAAVPGMPRWPQPDGRVKLSGAWLIEQAGLARGTRRGAAGLSTRHALAIVAHDGARAADVARLACEVRDTVQARFGVRLEPEPVFWGPIGLDLVN